MTLDTYNTHIPYQLTHLKSKEYICIALNSKPVFNELNNSICPVYRTYEIARGPWDVVIIYMCLTVYEFSFILFDFCLFITLFIFILNYVLIVTFWIFAYYEIWIMLNIYCFIRNYWIIYFVTCLEVFWSVMEYYELTGVSLLWTRRALANKAKIGLVWK